jgi:DNA-binding transcriptional MerR regulator
MQKPLIEEAALFPIGTVSEQTGVNSVTLRAWERRYQLLEPYRTPKGHRLYSQQDVDRVKQIVGLLKQGIAASQVREALDNNMSATPSVSLLASKSGDTPWAAFRELFRRCVQKLDIHSLDAAFNEAIFLYPLELVAEHLIFPVYLQTLKQAELLPSTTVDFTFLHEFLCAKLGLRYLQHNVHATNKHLLLANTSGANEQVTALLLANLFNIHGYKVNVLGDIAINHLPMALGRIQADAIVLIHHENTETLPVLARLAGIPLFVYGMAGNTVSADSNSDDAPIHWLPENLGEAFVLFENTLHEAGEAQEKSNAVASEELLVSDAMTPRVTMFRGR